MLLVYSGLIAYMIPHHEPWADEAQQWLLARSLSIWQLFGTYLHYEGQPGLWHLLLWLLVHARVTYSGMHWVTGAIAVCATALLLFRSPFPRWLKLSAPFTFFLFYQYAIVARAYVVAVLLIFLVAVFWRRSPVVLALVLGLLANTAAHAFAISVGFACAYAVELWTDRRNPAYEPRKYRLAAVILLVLLIVAALSAVPAPDAYAAGYGVSGERHRISFATTLEDGIQSLFIGLWRWLPVGAAGWYLVVAGLHSRSGLRYLLPVITFAGFCSVVYYSIWHAGLLVPTLLAILWITWPDRDTVPGSAEKMMRLAIAVLIVLQVWFGAEAYVYDLRNSYSPDLQAARVLAPYVEAGDLIAVTYVRQMGESAYHAVGIEPYFSGKLFVNQPMPFWWWSTKDTTEADFFQALARHPQVIVVEDYGLRPKELPLEMNNSKIRFIESRGYHLGSAVFGHASIMGFAAMQHCHLIFISDSVR